MSYQDVVSRWLAQRIEYLPGYNAKDGRAVSKHTGNVGKFMSDIYVFEDDEVRVDGVPLRFREPSEAVRCFAMHKPAGVSMEKAFDTKEMKRRQHERVRVQELQRMGRKDVSLGTSRMYAFLDKVPAGFFPVGRLDLDTTGLLLLTNCGDFGSFLTEPGKYVKEYECEILRPYLAVRDQSKIDLLLQGVPLAERKARAKGDEEEAERGPARASYVNMSGHVYAESGVDVGKTWILTMGIAEGRNRVVRRMMGYVKLPLGKLHRTKFGSVDINQLGLLRPGSLTELSAEAITQLWSSLQVDPAEEQPDAAVVSAEQRIIQAKIFALQRHAEYLKTPKVNHPNSRLEEWLNQHIPK